MAVKPTEETSKEATAYKKEVAQAAPRKAQQTKTVNKQVSQAKADQAKQSPSAGSSQQREVPCPICGPHVKKKDVTGGKKYFKIPFTDPAYKIPIPPFIAKTFDFDSSRRDGEKCKACEGKKKIKDVTDDSAKYKEVQQKAEQNIDKTLELEAKLGTGGSRTTIIQGSELLYVGLGFNRSDSYEVVKDGNISPGGVYGGKSAAFAGGYKSNAVVGKQTSAGWPSSVGNYTIKCANKLQLLTGSGGITMATKGPLTISAGITTISGPMVTIGSSSGPLTLEGDVVSISGKTVTITPTDKHLFVKGTISTTANMIVGGHTHSEGISFAKASCVGRNETSTMDTANPDNSQTFPAVWGGAGVKGITSSILDIQLWAQSLPMDVKTSAFRMMSPNENANLANRLGTLAKMVIPFEMTPTGYVFGVMPGTAMLPIFNFPHTHGLPPMQHTHDVRVPDIDCSHDSPDALRTKALNGAVESNATHVESNKTTETKNYIMSLVPSFLQPSIANFKQAIKKTQI